MKNLTMGRFYLQAGITAAAVVVCVFKILTTNGDSSAYWTGLMGILAYWMPAPNGQVETTNNRELSLNVESTDSNEININPDPSPNLKLASRQ